MRELLCLGMVVGMALAQGASDQPAASQPAEAPPTGETLISWLGADYAPCLEKLLGGQVDWTRGYVLAQGIGKASGASGQDVAMARRAARLTAARNAVLLMRGIRMDAEGRCADIRDGQVVVRGVLRDFEELAMEYDPRRRTVMVTLRASLHGFRGVAGRCAPPEAPEGPKWPGPEEHARADGTQLVVIDARGTSFVPVVYPSIITGDGRRVFDSGHVEPRRLRHRPMAVYATHRPPAGQAESQPARPTLILKAAGKDKAPGTLVLEDAAMEKLAADGAAFELMRQGRLVIVVDARAQSLQPEADG